MLSHHKTNNLLLAVAFNEATKGSHLAKRSLVSKMILLIFLLLLIDRTRA